MLGSEKIGSALLIAEMWMPPTCQIPIRTESSHADLSYWCSMDCQEPGSSAQCWPRPFWRRKDYKTLDNRKSVSSSYNGALHLWKAYPFCAPRYPQTSVFPALKTIDHTTSCSAYGLMWAWKALPRQHCGQVEGSTNHITPLFASLPSLGSAQCLFR